MNMILIQEFPGILLVYDSNSRDDPLNFLEDNI